MAIKLPLERAYYMPDPVERDRLLYWVPPGELAALVQRGQAADNLLNDYPSGLETEVSEQQFEMLGLRLPAPSRNLKQAFLDLRDYGNLPASGYVQADYVERVAREAAARLHSAAADMPGEPQGGLPLGPAPAPVMSEGEEPSVALRRLADAGRR